MAGDAGGPKIWRLVAIDKDDIRVEATFSCPATIGRGSTCDVRLQGRKISRQHFTIEQSDEGQLIVHDLGSHNGTLIDGKRIKKQALQDGALVKAGEWRVRIEAARTDSPSDRHGAVPVITDDFVEEDMTLDLTDPDQLKIDPRLLAQAKQPGGLVWSWEVENRKESSVLKRSPLSDNPLVEHITHATSLIESGEVPSLRQVAQRINEPSSQHEMERVALALLYRVITESHLALNLDEFLASIADAVLDATGGHGVAILLPSGTFNELRPRAVRLAEGVEQLKLSQTVVDAAVRDQVIVQADNALSDDRFADNRSVMRLAIRAVMCVPLARHDGKVDGAIYVTRNQPFRNPEKDLVAALGHLVGLGIEQARLREQVQAEAILRSSLERFHAPEVVEKIMFKAHGSRAAAVEPFLESMEATVVFADLCDFTTFAEQRPPARVADLLNSYFSRLTEVIFEHRGTVDKYIGDAIMAIFGAPFPGDDDAKRAVSCALAMRSAFGAVIAERPVEERLRIRIGINTGTVVAGLVGSKLRVEYTALGDAVNVAARLERTAKPGQILLGPRTAELVGRQFLLQPRGPILLKGKAEPLDVFEVIAAGALSTS